MDKVKLSYGTEFGTLPRSFYQPPSGIVDEAAKRSGDGEFNIENDGSLDGVVVLAQNQTTIVAVYVRAHESFQVLDIPDGTYTVYYALGSDWDGSTFNRDIVRRRFTEVFPFETTADTATAWTMTIQTQTGNSRGQDVDSQEFPVVVSDIEGE